MFIVITHLRFLKAKSLCGRVYQKGLACVSPHLKVREKSRPTLAADLKTTLSYIIIYSNIVCVCGVCVNAPSSKLALLDGHIKAL